MEKEIIGALYKSTELNEKQLLLDILDNFSDSFHKEKSKGLNVSFLFRVKCNVEYVEFNIHVKQSEFKIIHDYSDTNPYLIIHCDFETFSNITLGNFNPVRDIINGKIKLQRGILDLGRFAKFGTLFSYRKIDLRLPTSIKHPEIWKKPENILLVNGSPRKNASTHLMLEWFKEGITAEKLETIDVSSLKIARCLHCFKCWTDHPNQCVIDDDAKIFREKLAEADLIVFFVPLSYSSMPSDMKRAMERLFPETTPFFYYNKLTNLTAHPVQKNTKSQAFLQFLVWGFPEMHHGRILEENFNEWANHSHKNNLGSIKRPGINMILGDPRMQFVRQKIRQALFNTAKTVYETGKVPAKDKKIIEKEDYISVNDFQFYATKYWIKRFKTDFGN
jgi:multimeric flavodoxin WrbA/putative sterol carrier protein